MVNHEITGSGTDVLIDALLDSPDLKVFLQRLVAISAAELATAGSAAHCSVTVWRKRRPMTIASTDPETAAMDEGQYGSNQGPCMEAVRTRLPVEVVDLRTETRWPKFTAAMAGSPMRSVFALPIGLQTAGSAALNCYSTEVGPVADRTLAALVEFTAVAARALTLSVKLQSQADLSADLAAAMESRTAIDLAAGVIMAQANCDQQQAVEIMMKASSNRNEKLRDVALSVLSGFNRGMPATHFDLL